MDLGAGVGIGGRQGRIGRRASNACSLCHGHGPSPAGPRGRRRRQMPFSEAPHQCRGPAGSRAISARPSTQGEPSHKQQLSYPHPHPHHPANHSPFLSLKSPPYYRSQLPDSTSIIASWLVGYNRKRATMLSTANYKGAAKTQETTA